MAKPKLGTGDFVWVVSWWSVAPMRPGDPSGGSWEPVPGRVISVGPCIICYAPDNPHLPGYVGGDPGTEAPHGSPFRFVNPDRVYAARDDAEAAARGAPPPQTP